MVYSRTTWSSQVKLMLFCIVLNHSYSLKGLHGPHYIRRLMVTHDGKTQSFRSTTNSESTCLLYILILPFSCTFWPFFSQLMRGWGTPSAWHMKRAVPARGRVWLSGFSTMDGGTGKTQKREEDPSSQTAFIQHQQTKHLTAHSKYLTPASHI